MILLAVKGAPGFTCDISILLKNVDLCCADLQVSCEENTNNFDLSIISLMKNKLSRAKREFRRPPSSSINRTPRGNTRVKGEMRIRQGTSWGPLPKSLASLCPVHHE